jgi:hypothetical protein
MPSVALRDDTGQHTRLPNRLRLSFLCTPSCCHIPGCLAGATGILHDTVPSATMWRHTQVVAETCAVQADTPGSVQRRRKS